MPWLSPFTQRGIPLTVSTFIYFTKAQDMSLGLWKGMRVLKFMIYYFFFRFF